MRERVQAGADSDIYAVFPINIIERIEVIRGPGSVLYGTKTFLMKRYILRNGSGETGENCLCWY
ncbi:MAG: Plug domain-containing protein [bacterium]|nr:Plug domain-containing protein [bacterium]